jgi:hypothetical protein
MGARSELMKVSAALWAGPIEKAPIGAKGTGSRSSSAPALHVTGATTPSQSQLAQGWPL